MFKKINEACERFEQKIYDSFLLTLLSAFCVVFFLWSGTWFLAAII